MFRLRGQGIQGLRSKERADQIVKVTVVTPTRISREETELYQKLREFDRKREMKPGHSFLNRLKNIFS
jgi:molecular chaperone DnaJ